jgi:hypothetical protein
VSLFLIFCAVVSSFCVDNVYMRVFDVVRICQSGSGDSGGVVFCVVVCVGGCVVGCVVVFSCVLLSLIVFIMRITGDACMFLNRCWFLDIVVVGWVWCVICVEVGVGVVGGVGFVVGFGVGIGVGGVEVEVVFEVGVEVKVKFVVGFVGEVILFSSGS